MGAVVRGLVCSSGTRFVITPVSQMQVNKSQQPHEKVTKRRPARLPPPPLSPSLPSLPSLLPHPSHPLASAPLPHAPPQSFAQLPTFSVCYLLNPTTPDRSATEPLPPLPPLQSCPPSLFGMLAPPASRRRLLVVASSVAALLLCASLLAVLRPHAAASSKLSSARFFGRVSPDLARLMSKENVGQDDSAGLEPSSSSSSSSSNFYSDVSRTLGRLMAKRGVLAEDAAELRDSDPAARVAVPQQLPYATPPFLHYMFVTFGQVR